MSDSTQNNTTQPPIAGGERGISVVQDLLDFGILSEEEAAYYLEQLATKPPDDQPGGTT